MSPHYLARRWSLAAVFAVAGCAESSIPTAPTLSAHQAPLSHGRLGGARGLVEETSSSNFRVQPALRSQPLASDVTWSFVAGPFGVVSTNLPTGLTVVVPPGALHTRKTITVTALAGSSVAYRFEPHGLQFQVPVLLNQSLLALAPTPDPLFGGYFPADAPEIDPATGLTIVTELPPSRMDLTAGLLQIGIRHFSGYIAASGRSGNRDADAAGQHE